MGQKTHVFWEWYVSIRKGRWHLPIARKLNTKFFLSIDYALRWFFLYLHYGEPKTIYIFFQFLIIQYWLMELEGAPRFGVESRCQASVKQRETSFGRAFLSRGISRWIFWVLKGSFQPHGKKSLHVGFWGVFCLVVFFLFACLFLVCFVHDRSSLWNVNILQRKCFLKN